MKSGFVAAIGTVIMSGGSTASGHGRSAKLSNKMCTKTSASKPKGIGYR